MPNYCSYEMRVRGKEEAVEEFIEILQADYRFDENRQCDCERHFWRVFDANVLDKHFENGEGYAEINGDCAWSVYSCMCDGSFTYNNDFPNMGGTTLQAESERLNISIEVFSSEPGCQFMEHYVYDNGHCVAEECEDWEEYCTDDFETVEEMNAECGTDFTKEEFEENDFLSIGGISWEYDLWING